MTEMPQRRARLRPKPPRPLLATTAGQASAVQPRLTLLTQYVNDLSFENPNAPVIYAQLEAQPRISGERRRRGEPHPGQTGRGYAAPEAQGQDRSKPWR